MFNLANAYRDTGDIDSAVKHYIMAYQYGDATPAISNCLNMLQTSDLDLDTRMAYDEYILQFAPIDMVYNDIDQINACKEALESASE